MIILFGRYKKVTKISFGNMYLALYLIIVLMFYWKFYTIIRFCYIEIIIFNNLRYLAVSLIKWTFYFHTLFSTTTTTLFHLGRPQWTEILLILLNHFLVTGKQGGVVSLYFYRSYKLPLHENNPRIWLVFCTCNSQGNKYS